MTKAVWNGAVIAEADNTVVVERNHYFPADSVNMDLLQSSPTTSRCPWKGTASYYTIAVGDRTNTDAAWTYAEPLSAAANIKGHLAFWKGVEVQ